MDFSEKLQQLRKSRGLTQEELAEVLYVSRTAVSKWESNRGYPSIDSLKAISGYFSVSIDDLLSGEKLLSIAEKETKTNLRNICGLLYGMTDLFFVLLIVLPLYPKTEEGFVCSVSLFSYNEAAPWIRTIYWSLFLGMMLMGMAKTLLLRLKPEKDGRKLTGGSMLLHITAVLFLALAGETYAVVMVFLLLIVKGLLLFKAIKGL